MCDGAPDAYCVDRGGKALSLTSISAEAAAAKGVCFIIYIDML